MQIHSFLLGLYVGGFLLSLLWTMAQLQGLPPKDGSERTLSFTECLGSIIWPINILGALVLGKTAFDPIRTELARLQSDMARDLAQVRERAAEALRSGSETIASQQAAHERFVMATRNLTESLSALLENIRGRGGYLRSLLNAQASGYAFAHEALKALNAQALSADAPGLSPKEIDETITLLRESSGAALETVEEFDRDLGAVIRSLAFIGQQATRSQNPSTETPETTHTETGDEP